MFVCVTCVPQHQTTHYLEIGGVCGASVTACYYYSLYTVYVICLLFIRGNNDSHMNECLLTTVLLQGARQNQVFIRLKH